MHRSACAVFGRVSSVTRGQNKNQKTPKNQTKTTKGTRGRRLLKVLLNVHAWATNVQRFKGRLQCEHLTCEHSTVVQVQLHTSQHIAKRLLQKPTTTFFMDELAGIAHNANDLSTPCAETPTQQQSMNGSSKKFQQTLFLAGGSLSSWFF